MMATLIVGLMTMCLYRFLDIHLRAMHVMTEVDEERTSLETILRVVEAQLLEIPSEQAQGLIGEAYRFHGQSNDAITWRCAAGNGLLTTSAPGEFWVTLTVQPVSANSAETELGLRRRPILPEDAISVDLSKGQGQDRYNWLSLIRPMAAIEVRYFDARLGSWVDRWADPQRRPQLVKISLWKHPEDAPIVSMMPIPSSRQSL